MVNFRKVCFSALTCITVLQVFLLVSCKSREDFHYDDDGISDTYTTPDYGDTITVLRTHTEGEGVPIVIMADGYTASDISSGSYRKAVLRADTALFSIEPMASLKQYFDIIMVKIPSNVSGITSQAQNTAFKTRYADSENSTAIYGDDETIEQWARNALGYAYETTVETTIQEKFLKTQIITLLNCDKYKGITLMSFQESGTDSIPTGFSLSYIPAQAHLSLSGSDRDVFKDLIQHEAVGHGIGKLGDEYFYPSLTPPTKGTKDSLNVAHKYGVLMNIACDETAAEDEYAYTFPDGNHSYCINTHPLYPTDMAYPLKQDSRYTNEDIAWYQGGDTYLTYTNNLDPAHNALICEKDFYHPSKYCIMNNTGDANNSTFNAISRLAIYKRVKRAALGTSFKCNLHNADDLDAFANFDAPSRTTSSGAKAAWTAPESDTTTAADVPLLAAPRIIRLPKY